MSPLRSPLAESLRLVIRFPVITVLAGLLAAGCSAHTRTTQNGWSTPGDPYDVAAAPAPRVELEDDGHEAQLPPPRRVRTEPDDPSEPYSRNYGSAPARRTADSPGRTRLSGDLPPAFRRQLASALPPD